MNLNEYKESFLFKGPSSSSYSFIPKTIKTGNVYIFVIANIQSFTSQIFGVIGPLGQRWDLTFKQILIKLYLVRGLKCYLNAI